MAGSYSATSSGIIGGCPWSHLHQADVAHRGPEVSEASTGPLMSVVCLACGACGPAAHFGSRSDERAKRYATEDAKRMWNARVAGVPQ